MSEKSKKIRNAIDNITKQKIVLYHVISPIDGQKFAQIKENGYFDVCKNALGGQSGGYYFFTTHQGAEYHIKTNRDVWEKDSDKHAYLVECEVNANDIKYPNWKIDYEAMQDFLFDMIYKVVSKGDIIFQDIKISALDNNKLSVISAGKYEKIKSFTADKHSGLIEQISDFLYKNDAEFKNSYDDLLIKILSGDGENCELYAIKTKTKQKITKITQIEEEPIEQIATNSQIDKFLSRYGHTRR